MTSSFFIFNCETLFTGLLILNRVERKSLAIKQADNNTMKRSLREVRRKEKNIHFDHSMFCFRNPTWWKRRSTLERGLTVIAVCGVLLCIALAVALGVLVANTATCDTSSRNGKNICKCTV